MGVTTGPRTVTSGLVLSLDAGNENSFRGEPTTNNLPNTSEDMANASKWSRESWGGTVTANYGYAPDGTKSTTRIIHSGGYYYKHSNVSPTITGLTSGVTVTFSCYINSVSGQTGRGIGLWSYSIGGIVATSTGQTVTPGFWQRLSVTYTITSASAGDFAIMISGDPANILQGDIEAWHPQFEFKNYATPFTSGTRGLTVATGGGWKDLSDYENNAEFITTPIFDSSYLGCLILDGTDKRIKVLNSDSINFGLGNFSIELVLNFYDLDNQYILNKGAYGGGRGYATGIGSGNLTFGIEGDSNQAAGTSLSNLGIVASANTHIILVCNRGIDTALFYINGNLKYTQDISSFTGTTTGTNDLYVVSQYESGSWAHHKRYITRLYSKVLTSSEVLQNFNALRSRFGI